MHIRCTQVYHRHYPELRGEGTSLRNAAVHLTAQLTQALEFAHGPEERVEIERVLQDVRALREDRSRPQPRRRDGAAPARAPITL